MSRQDLTTIERQLAFVHMSEEQRAAALRDAFLGELIADAVIWVCSKIRRPDAAVFAAPTPKH